MAKVKPMCMVAQDAKQRIIQIRGVLHGFLLEKRCVEEPFYAQLLGNVRGKDPGVLEHRHDGMVVLCRRLCRLKLRGICLCIMETAWTSTPSYGFRPFVRNLLMKRDKICQPTRGRVYNFFSFCTCSMSVTTHIFPAFRIEEIAVPHVENKIVFHAMCDWSVCIEAPDHGLACDVNMHDDFVAHDLDE